MRLSGAAALSGGLEVLSPLFDDDTKDDSANRVLLESRLEVVCCLPRVGDCHKAKKE